MPPSHPPPSLPAALAAQVSALAAADWGRSPAQIGGAPWPVSSLALLAMLEARPGVYAVVLPSPQAREAMLTDLAALAPDLDLIEVPAEEYRTGNTGNTMMEWMPALRRMANLGVGDSTLVVCIAANLLTPLPDERKFRASNIHLRTGQSGGQRDLLEKLSNAGYENEHQVEYPGQFSVRGSIVDVWPHAEEFPVRLDYFGDDIEDIRRFDAATQRSVAKLKEVHFPLLAPKVGGGDDLTGGLLNYLPDFVTPVFVERGETLLRVEALRPFVRGSGKQARLEALESWLAATPRIELSATEVMQRRGALNLSSREFRPLAGGSEAACETLRALLGEGFRIEVYAGSSGEARRFALVLEANEVLSDRIQIRDEEISASALLADDRLALLSGADLLGKERLRKGLRGDEVSLASTPHRAIEDFVRLENNDYVVHINHGIARYRGIEELLTPDGSRGEYLRLEFDEGVEVHVPVTSADLVQKYIGSRGAAPKLSKYQTKRWSERKLAVQQAVLKLAADMLHLQALRQAGTGYAFTENTDTLLDFVESFPYRDTPDQERTWSEIEADMAATRPMDRLVCGDVGFGKTELAMRAAFKAVMAGKQVAVLVPTTVLCQQHYQNFIDRMKGHPVLVDSISRFKTKAEQKETLQRAKEGRVDILIGTHRLVSADVQFRDLGLVIIDEEQKFGVEHKEKLKGFRETVDVLTLSATPIPRTLHMSLLGIRDISSLTTPPEHRKPVATSLHRFQERFITENIRAELQRDGQIYFVHNRVNDIKDIAAKIKTWVPEARVGVGHGQMPEGELEDIMIRFINRELDVLVCTTIIESGIDVRTANTMFINRADHHGLANLHQLRGRVGRYKNNAFCYLLVGEQANVNEIAEKRLRAILQHSRLGSGFYIAMRDLEIRGAGNIIGKEQSGHIASVGYDLYCQMLEQAVKQLRGEYVLSAVETSVDLDLDTVLPRKWIPEAAARTEVYRMVARCRTPDQAEEITRDLTDRFGKVPKKIDTLLRLAVVRHRLGALGITSVTVGRMVSHGPPHFKFRAVSAAGTLAKVKELAPRLRVVDERTLSLPLGSGMENPQDQLRYLWNMLQMMAAKGVLREAPARASALEAVAAG